MNLNNNINAVTDFVSNEIVLKFKFKKVITVLTIKKFIVIASIEEKFNHDRFIFRKKTIDVTSFINVETKIYYDVRHKSLLLKKKKLRVSEIKLWLSTVFTFKSQILSTTMRFLFRSTKNKSFRLRIKAVVDVKNAFNCFRRIVEIKLFRKDQNRKIVKYRIWKKLRGWLDYQSSRQKIRQTSMVQYFVRWKNYELEFDEWKSFFKLKECTELIKKYEKIHFVSIVSTKKSKIVIIIRFLQHDWKVR